MELRSLDSLGSAHISRSQRICSEVLPNDYSCCWIQGGPCQCIQSLYMKRQFFLRLNKKGKEYPWCTLAICSMLTSLMNSSHWNSVAFVSTQHQTGPIFNELLRMLSYHSVHYPTYFFPWRSFRNKMAEWAKMGSEEGVGGNFTWQERKNMHHQKERKHIKNPLLGAKCESQQHCPTRILSFEPVSFLQVIN